jgi:transposase-like protein
MTGTTRPARTAATPATGTCGKTVLTKVGPVEISVPRDRDGTFEPKIVRKGHKCLSGVDEMVVSPPARALKTGEVEAHLAEVYGADVFKQTISTNHRQGHGRHGRVTEPASRRHPAGRLHRRGPREDPQRCCGRPA